MLQLSVPLSDPLIAGASFVGSAPRTMYVQENLMAPKMEGDELVFIVEEDIDGGYFAHAVGQSIVTQADTREQVAEMVRDAVRCHFDSPADMPKRIRLHYVHDEVVAL